ncbi:hypothetical protein C5N14_26045 [Micromonospora sp. MW-13]|nr:hypothetical protein [Micromonospora sp. MW-13]RGC66032.1 hypothetical protein C5N14_26045 [Micromonospora sp. MW-13]
MTIATPTATVTIRASDAGTAARHGAHARMSHYLAGEGIVDQVDT